jgi:hypothetical protein
MSLVIAALLAIVPATDVDLYTRSGCPRCAEAEVYLGDLAGRRPGLRVRIRDIQRDPCARTDLARLARERGAAPEVPSFHVRGFLIVGWTGRDTTGRRIEALLDGAPPPETPPEAGRGEPAVRTRDRLSAPRACAPCSLAAGLPWRACPPSRARTPPPGAPP